ncbi:uncharacterized protein LOC133744555 [Rosa rugosa]|uniref:uncharacterized protein LOC133744555 n=1 Tax=Rosa rugosa TaxID=74645 RepID=UPI002B40CE0B|nr:uncharacterized protein LOC133744555 [Rosa rugosa]
MPVVFNLYPHLSQNEPSFITRIGGAKVVVDSNETTVFVHRHAVTSKEHLCNYVLIAKIFGKRVPPKKIVRKCNQHWANLQGTVRMRQLINGWYTLEFTYLQDVEFVLEHCPWFVKGRIFHIRGWYPVFNPRTAVIETLILWVRLPNLPIQYWSTDAIKPIVQVLGRFIKLDKKTEESENFILARVCMEIDLRVPLK